MADTVPEEQPQAPASAPPRVPLALAGLYAGAAGGVLAAVVDFALGFGRVAQFLPGPMGRLTLALFLAGLYGLFGALIGAALGLLGTLLGRGSDLGPLARAALERHAARRREGPQAGIGVTAWAITVPVMLGAAALLIFVAALTSITRFHHPGLIAALIGTAATGVVLGCLVVAFPLQRALALALGAAGRGAAGRALGSPAAAVVAFVVTCGAPLPIIAALTWETTRLLPFRPFVVAFVYLAGTVGACALGRRARPGRLGGPIARAALAVLLVAALLGAALVAGRFERVRKAASSYAAFATPLTVALRAAIDLDRDGYSAVLGGNDCNDLDGDVNPGAFDWPDDGIDQNCDGVDATVRRPRPPPFAAVPATVPENLNLLLISIDALRADHLGAYGYTRATSPTIDAIAREGALFENGFAHAPSTRYSMPAILTGRYPSRIAWGTAWWPNVLPENPRIPVALKRAGYYTGAIFSYRYFDKIRQFDLGFDSYDNRNSRLHHGTYDPATHGSSSPEQTDAAIRFVDEHRAQKFFLWVHYYDPHWFYERHPDDPATIFGDGGKPGATRPGDLMDLYDGEIRYTDDHFARLVAHLKQLGLYDRTAIVITGDHGEGFGEHGIDFHGYHLYTPQTKVPFIVRVPGLKPQRPREPVGHVDIAPTLVNLARGTPEPRFLGRSFVDLLVDGAGPERHVLQEVMYEGPTVRKAVVSRDWQLVYNMVPDQTWELYHLANDPLETHDLSGAADTAAAAAPLKRELLAWIEQEDIPEDWHERVDPAVRKQGQPRFTPTHPLDLRFGDAVRLYGYDLATPTVRRGGTIDVTWYFESRGRLKGPWRIFVHGLGHGFLNGDHDPIEGLLPLRDWPRGATIADRQKIQVPPHLRPGTYTFYLGIYAGRERLPVRGEGADPQQHRAQVLTVTVTP